MGNPLKHLQTDNGGEYISKDFKEYCSKHGIKHKKTIPGTPQHNDIVERMNQTIAKKVWCMLKMAKLPKSFQGEALNATIYLMIRSPSIPLGFDILKRV